MFVPIAVSYASDSDTAVVSWERDRKVVHLLLNCYGSPPKVRVGLRNPPGGSVDGLSLDEAWAWYCDDTQTVLPKPPTRATS